MIITPTTKRSLYLFILLLVCHVLPSGVGHAFPPELSATKKVMIVHSYEPGQVCGQPQMDGILAGLEKTGFTEDLNISINHFFMDTKTTYTTVEQIAERGKMALAMIEDTKPDLVITIDDNAAKTVMLNLAGTATPVVFCGMNKQPESYNLEKKFMENRKKPGGNVTGVYEKLHVTRSLDVMHAITGLQKAAVIVDSSPSGEAVKLQVEKEISLSNSPVQLIYHQAKTFEEFKRIILAANEDPEIGAIYPVAVTLPTVNETPATAKEIFTWMLANSKKPEMAANYFFSRLGMFGGAAVDFLAMGEQAGIKAAAILNGTPAGDIAIDDARDQSLVFNVARARQLDITIPIDILSAADIIYDSVLLQQKTVPFKMLIVQSYEKGVGCGSTIENGFIRGLATAGYLDGQKIDLYHYHMDTQHKHITENAIKNQAQLALAEIKRLDPQLVILLDDNAFEHVLPSLVSTSRPVLFGGTNVPLERYNQTIQFMNNRERPGKNVTGVTEEHELMQSLRLIKGLVPTAETAVIIYSTATPFASNMGKANEDYIEKNRDTLPIRFIEPVFVSSFSDYKKAVKKYNNDPAVDIIYTFAPISLIKDDNSISSVQETVSWMASNQKKPGFTWMTNWVKLGYLASAGIDVEETGNKLALQAVKIINGADPGTLPITDPSKYSITLNLDRARFLNITIPVDILEAAEKVYP